MKEAIIVLQFILLGYSGSFAAPEPRNPSYGIAAGGDPFIPYLSVVPRILQTISDSTSGAGPAAITTREIVFSSRGGANRIYGLFAFPARAGKYPGLLVLHGGSGNASDLREVVEKFARQGYVAFACDMAGYCNIDEVPFSTGPWKVHPAPDERPRFDIEGGLTNSTLVDAEVAGLNAFNLLCAMPAVDKKRVGITGYSWGGYSATMLAGLLGSRVRAVYSFWGCGYFDQGSFWSRMIEELSPAVKSRWLAYFDAGRRASRIRANYFLEAASNDTYFWPDAVSATLQSITASKNHVWRPNVNHKEVPTSALMLETYFKYWLKDEGEPFPSVAIASVKLQADSSRDITFIATLPAGTSIKRLQVFSSDTASNWQSKVWHATDVEPTGAGLYTVHLAAQRGQRPANFYVQLVDKRDVAVSSDMY